MTQVGERLLFHVGWCQSWLQLPHFVALHKSLQLSELQFFLRDVDENDTNSHVYGEDEM